MPRPEIHLSGRVVCAGGTITVDATIVAHGHPGITAVRAQWTIGGTYYGIMSPTANGYTWTAHASFPVPDPTGSSWLVNIGTNVVDSDTNADSAGATFDTPCTG
jgi:hypothetical protein